MYLNPQPRPRRRSIRLHGFDYSRQGAYFVTICTRNRECLLGDVAEGVMRLNEVGQLAQAAWEDLPRHYPHVVLDAWTVMPNHVHGIVVLSDGVAEPTVGAGFKPAPTSARAARHGPPSQPAPGTTRHGLPEVVRAFKTFSARRINALRGAVGTPFWQRNYYEHIIRDDQSLNRIRQYIEDNPAQWHRDPENPAVVRTAGGSP